MRESGARYQCDKAYIEPLDKKALYDGFMNNGIGWCFNVTIPILSKCIEEDSNQPYWNMYYPFNVGTDLRNSKFSEKLAEIRKQLNLQFVFDKQIKSSSILCELFLR